MEISCNLHTLYLELEYLLCSLTVSFHESHSPFINAYSTEYFLQQHETFCVYLE